MEALKAEEEEVKMQEEEARRALQQQRALAREEREKKRKAESERRKAETEKRRAEQRATQEAAKQRELEMLESISGTVQTFNPSNAEATFVPSKSKPVMLVFIGIP